MHSCGQPLKQFTQQTADWIQLGTTWFFDGYFNTSMKTSFSLDLPCSPAPPANGQVQSLDLAMEPLSPALISAVQTALKP